MIFDVLTLQAAAALVIVVSAVMYLLDTIMLKDGLPGRLWASAYLSGTFSAVCYLAWLLLPDVFVAVAVGNGAFVAATGFIWLGCVAFNGRAQRVPSIVLGVVVLLVVVSALAAGPAGGDWAGAVPFFLGNALFAVLGAIETRRGAIAKRWSAVGLTVILAVEALWFVSRTGVFLTSGPDSELFRTVFDTRISAVLTITLVIAAVTVTSVLRANESALRGSPDVRRLSVDANGVLFRESFEATLAIVCARAELAAEGVCVIGIRIDDLKRVAVAFGPEDAEEIARELRGAVRRHSPTMALVGEADTTGLAVAFTTGPTTDIGRVARVLHERVVSDLSRLGTAVVPVVGVGVAVTADHGHDSRALVLRADEAAARAAATGEQSFRIA
ncbi:GGDEF domain-containing protein, diguanylate cyclase (c-di-GMP synthetase) or its enzymatically inactive variants [Microbacterium sp. ru370.1]|uniref:diguanylate cyclase domain-containing protein n=1 Tax=Microbacterium sp. ru370.1 TaxID=1761809 RepID=UPI00087FF703|nr:diguanylate cyclase [Microbacterium sp. ru370.1]SDO72384.1 GGDEF domain-containing protein, diguanylate cyclase (c-di-GMP synthetase) or its enzymatically inactive variants [Microbacterium sp. ru370.1]SIT87597.1 GGDEF domain-containing protein, diguanylate cyclase (c-di-GMP synthetase) or its enzymatically inactive variants [Microbacterium sp. RU1D]